MRVYAPLEDQAVSELDRVAQEKGISRAQLIINAIDSYLHQPEPSTEELDQTRIKLDEANSQLDQLRIKMDHINSELDRTRIELDRSKAEAANLKDELKKQKTKFGQITVEETKRWEELKGYKQFNFMLCGFSVTAKTEEELLEHIRDRHMGFDWRWGFFPVRL